MEKVGALKLSSKLLRSAVLVIAVFMMYAILTTLESGAGVITACLVVLLVGFHLMLRLDAELTRELIAQQRGQPIIVEPHELNKLRETALANGQLHLFASPWSRSRALPEEFLQNTFLDPKTEQFTVYMTRQMLEDKDDWDWLAAYDQIDPTKRCVFPGEAILKMMRSSPRLFSLKKGEVIPEPSGPMWPMVSGIPPELAEGLPIKREE